MKRLSKTSLIIIIIVLALVIVVGIFYISLNNTHGLKAEIDRLTVERDYYQGEYEIKDFHYTVASAECDNLEQIIMDKDNLILELRGKEQSYHDALDILDYSVTYIHYLQMLMDDANVAYPEWIVESVLSDDYYGDID